MGSEETLTDRESIMWNTKRVARFGWQAVWPLVAGVVMVAASGCAPGPVGAPTRLRCEYQEYPLAVDTSVPRLSWYVNDTRRGARQTAYQVLVASSPDRLTPGTADLWDSGKVISSNSAHVCYGGMPLRSGRDYYWKVRTWDADGVPSPYSALGAWEMGLREPADWVARWVHVLPTAPSTGGDPPGWRHGQWIWHPTAKGDKQTVYLRKEFTLDAAAKVKQARIRCTADNRFTLFVNGQKVGSGDNWQKTYDYQVAARLRPGKNVIAVAPWNEGSQCGFRLAMRVDVEGKPPVWVLSDNKWKAVDREQKGWTGVDFDDGKWVASGVIGKYGCKPWGGQASPKATMHRSLMFRKEFSLDQPARQIHRARAYVCGLGAYELRLNGRRVGNDCLTPGWTQFHKRIQYQTYDVTDLLDTGANAVGAILGNGWWHGRIAGERNQSGRESLRLILQLDVEYRDGSRQRILSDPSWKACLSPICRDSIYDGETYDARLEKPGWDRVGFDDQAWMDVEPVDQSLDKLVPQAKDTIRPIQDQPAVGVAEAAPGVYIFDFGQNLTGWVRLKVQGERGTKVTLRHAEVMKDGKFYTANLRKAKATDTYTLKGGGVEVWEPRFTYHGFRFVEVTGYPGRPDKDALVARMVCSAEPQVGRFECSHGLLNDLQHNILWGQRSNMYSVPTDCPQRDERLGWMGDAQIFCNTSCWNLEMVRFYTKWMRDIADCQEADGAVHDWNPTNSTAPAKPAWGDACVVVPWQIYRHYGDTRAIEENYDCMVAWVDYLTRHSKNHLFERDGYGDWIAVVPSPKKPISAAYYYYDCVLLSEMARAIGRDCDAEKYAGLAREIRNAFNDKFLDLDANQYPGGTQTANLLPLFFGMVPPHRVDAVADNVVKDIAARGGHLSTGFLGTGYINPVLTATGHHGVAWRLATQTTYPSWGYMVKKGATTIWELWNSDVKGPGMNSRNHFALGAVGEWFYESLAGIVMAEPGFRRIRIAPKPVGDLTWVRASIWTVYGPVVSNWTLRDGDLEMAVLLPANTTGRIYVPTFGQRTFTVTESGRLVVKDGKYAGSAPGITFVGMEGQAAVFRAGAGQYRLVAHGVGRPEAVASELPAPPPGITELADDFAGERIDAAKWELVDLGLESTAPSGIQAKVADGGLVFDGTTGVDYWAGKTLRSRGGFTVDNGQQLEAQIDRIALHPKGTGTRTSLWFWVDPANYLMFSQDTEVKTWSYNLNGQQGNGVELAKVDDGGRHVMKLVHDGDSVHVLLDGKELADVAVSWKEQIRVAVTGQARKKGDQLTAKFDDFRATLVKSSGK